MKKSELKQLIREEISKTLSEISPETFKSAISTSRVRGTHQRT